MTRDAGKDVGEEQTKKLLEAMNTRLATVKISVQIFQKRGIELPNDTAIPHIPEGRAAINMPQRYPRMYDYSYPIHNCQGVEPA